MNANQLADLSEQLFNLTAMIKVDGESHRVVIASEGTQLYTDERMLTPFQAAWFLEHESIEEVDSLTSACGLDDCISHLQFKTPAVTDEDLLQLVQRSSVSLADLYRKGKQRGLIKAAPKGYA